MDVCIGPVHLIDGQMQRHGTLFDSPSTPRVSALLSLCVALDALKSDIYFISMISCRSRFEEVKSRNSNSAVDPTSWGTGGVLVELSSF